jgi:hypothetical protein
MTGKITGRRIFMKERGKSSTPGAFDFTDRMASFTSVSVTVENENSGILTVLMKVMNIFQNCR